MSELNYLEINAGEEKSREENSNLAFSRGGAKFFLILLLNGKQTGKCI